MGEFRHGLDVRAFGIQRMNLYYLKIYFFYKFQITQPLGLSKSIGNMLVLGCQSRTGRRTQDSRQRDPNIQSRGISSMMGISPYTGMKGCQGVAEDKRETCRAHVVKTLVPSWGSRLPESNGNVKQQVICIYKGQSENFIEYRLDGGQPGSKKIS